MAVHDECKLKFLELKTKRTYRFIVFKIEKKQKQVIVEKVGEPGESYEKFTANLLADECRYAVYDLIFPPRKMSLRAGFSSLRGDLIIKVILCYISYAIVKGRLTPQG